MLEIIYGHILYMPKRVVGTAPDRRFIIDYANCTNWAVKEGECEVYEEARPGFKAGDPVSFREFPGQIYKVSAIVEICGVRRVVIDGCPVARPESELAPVKLVNGEMP
jgi:hypothetical protein